MKDLFCLLTGVGLGFVAGVTFYEKVLLKGYRPTKSRPIVPENTLTDAERLAADFYAGVGKTSNSYSNIF